MTARFYDTKIVHAEQHVHLRGALLWRRAFWGYSGTILPDCLEAAAFPGIPAIASRPARTARTGRKWPNVWRHRLRLLYLLILSAYILSPRT